jgi:hypothetical protein
MVPQQIYQKSSRIKNFVYECSYNIIIIIIVVVVVVVECGRGE